MQSFALPRHPHQLIVFLSSHLYYLLLLGFCVTCNILVQLQEKAERKRYTELLEKQAVKRLEDDSANERVRKEYEDRVWQERENQLQRQADARRRLMMAVSLSNYGHTLRIFLDMFRVGSRLPALTCQSVFWLSFSI